MENKLSLFTGNNSPETLPGTSTPDKIITPMRPDRNPDPTTPKPTGNEPDKIDPTKIEELPKINSISFNNLLYQNLN